MDTRLIQVVFQTHKQKHLASEQIERTAQPLDWKGIPTVRVALTNYIIIGVFLYDFWQSFLLRPITIGLWL